MLQEEASDGPHANRPIRVAEVAATERHATQWQTHQRFSVAWIKPKDHLTLLEILGNAGTDANARSDLAGHPLEVARLADTPQDLQPSEKTRLQSPVLGYT